MATAAPYRRRSHNSAADRSATEHQLRVQTVSQSRDEQITPQRHARSVTATSDFDDSEREWIVQSAGTAERGEFHLAPGLSACRRRSHLELADRFSGVAPDRRWIGCLAIRAHLFARERPGFSASGLFNASTVRA